MANSFFKFKRFTVQQDRTAMKVTTDACLFGAWVANEAKNKNAKNKNVLDVGTGTGLLSLMLAQKSLTSVIDAIEIDREAYEQAKENVFGSPFATQITLINDDAKIFPFPKKYDIIISNPPFYENELQSTDQKKNIAHHHSSLLLKELLSVIKLNLTTDGLFYLLLPYKRNQEIKAALFENDLSILKIIFVRQSTRHDYFRIMLAGKIKNEREIESMIDEISIWNDEQQYTNEFKELLKDYYLGLTSQPPLR
jgi:tRNA1Val (adenine37-N6)-methyltransferase